MGAAGNCFASCVASILELSLEQVPPLRGPTQDADLDAWLRRYGWRTETTLNPGDWYPDGLYIANGTSPRSPERNHAVVAFGGRLFWDPHPDRSGILDVQDVIVLRPV